jgi:hypothetical protein
MPIKNAVISAESTALILRLSLCGLTGLNLAVGAG